MSQFRYTFGYALRQMKSCGATAQLPGGPTLRIAYGARPGIVTDAGEPWMPDLAALLSDDWIVSRAPVGAELPGGG